MEVFQHFHRKVADRAGTLLATENGAARFRRSDEGTAKPLTQVSLNGAGAGDGCLDAFFVESCQRLIYVAETLQVVLGDHRGLRRQVPPKVLADHLELNRFHELPGYRLDGVGARLHANRQQVVYQFFRHPVCKDAPGISQRPGDRLEGRLAAHALEVVADAQLLREDRGIRVELGQVVFPDDEEHPQPGVGLQRLAQLPDEFLPVLPAFGIKGKELLELIEDDDLRLLPGGARTRAEELGKACLGKFPRIDPRLHPAQEGVEGVEVPDLLPADVVRDQTAHSRHRENCQLPACQKGDQPGVDEGGLAGAGLGIDEDDAVGDDEGFQLVGFALPSEEKVLVLCLKGAWPHVGLELGGHLKASHRLLNSAANSWQVPQYMRIASFP